jgi:hypothetical protein
MSKAINSNLIYVLRTKRISGNVLNVVSFVCDEFIASKQTVEKMIQCHARVRLPLTRPRGPKLLQLL